MFINLWKWLTQEANIHLPKNNWLNKNNLEDKLFYNYKKDNLKLIENLRIYLGFQYKEIGVRNSSKKIQYSIKTKFLEWNVGNYRMMKWFENWLVSSAGSRVSNEWREDNMNKARNSTHTFNAQMTEMTLNSCLNKGYRVSKTKLIDLWMSIRSTLKNQNSQKSLLVNRESSWLN